jgi:hypothetical protein
MVINGKLSEGGTLRRHCLLYVWCRACVKKSNEKCDNMHFDGIKRLSNLKTMPHLKIKYF